MKLLLTIKSGTLAGQSYDLTTGAMSIGRSDSCTVRFDPLAEKIASKQHAFIEARPDGFYLIDNQSTNGTLLNDKPVQSVELNSGDVVQFGKNGPTAEIFIENTDFQPLSVNAFQPEQMTPMQQGYWGEQFQPPQMAGDFPHPPENLSDSFSFIGLNPPPIMAEENKTGKYIGVAAAILGFAFLGVIAMLLIGFDIGFITAIVASIIAFTPAAIYIIPLLFLDRYDPEPPWLLACAFAWGAIVAVVFSMIVNTTIGEIVLGVTGSAGLATIASTVISAPIFEEMSKGLGVVILLVFFRREFDDILDGIVYGGVIGLGFATVENVIYYGRGVNDGAEMLVYLLIVRGIASPFIHVTFTAMTGIGCGIARESHNLLVKITMPILGYIAAVTLHMLWNGTAVFFGRGFWFAYGILGVPFFLICIAFCVYIMYRQNSILKEMLALDVARGMIPQEHYKKATSAFRSTGWLIEGIFNGKFKTRKRYLRSIGKLGLSYWHIQRATAAQGHTGSFQQNPILRDEVLKWRGQV